MPYLLAPVPISKENRESMITQELFLMFNAVGVHYSVETAGA